MHSNNRDSLSMDIPHPFICWVVAERLCDLFIAPYQCKGSDQINRLLGLSWGPYISGIGLKYCICNQVIGKAGVECGMEQIKVSRGNTEHSLLVASLCFILFVKAVQITQNAWSLQDGTKSVSSFIVTLVHTVKKNSWAPQTRISAFPLPNISLSPAALT